MFYGGIAGGVVLISKAPGGSAASLNQYLFGAITTTTPQDLAVFAVLAALILVVTLGLGRHLFAVANDEEYARASGMPVLPLNLVLAVLTATTVVVSMRVVGPAADQRPDGGAGGHGPAGGAQLPVCVGAVAGHRARLRGGGRDRVVLHQHSVRRLDRADQPSRLFAVTAVVTGGLRWASSRV